MRVLLVQPRQKPGVGFKNVMVVEPLGLEMIGASLIPRHEVRLIDVFKLGDLIRGAAEFVPQVCGISCSFTVDVPQTLQIAQFLKSLKTKPFIFIGGHHASLSPHDFSDSTIDAVVVGEGEVTTSELMMALEDGQDLGSVPGLILNTPDGQFTTPPRDLIPSLDGLPYPARYLTKQHRNNYFMGLLRPTASVETARGCPFRCNFCSVWHFFRGKCRFKSPERIVDEIARLDESHVFFTDDNFLSNVPRAIEVM